MRLPNTTMGKKLITLAATALLFVGYAVPSVAASSALKNLGKGARGAAEEVAPAVPVKTKPKNAAINAPKAPGNPSAPKAPGGAVNNPAPGGIYQKFKTLSSPKPPVNVVKKPAAGQPAVRNLVKNPNPQPGFPKNLPAPLNAVKKPLAKPPSLAKPQPKAVQPKVQFKIPGAPPAKIAAKQKPYVPGAALRQAPDAPRVYDVSLAGDLKLDRIAKKFTGDIDVDAKTGQVFLKGNGSIGDLKLGDQFTKGGVSRVYALKNDATKVVKVVGLKRSRRQVLDQEVGRKMLNDVKAKSPMGDLFSVAKQDRFEVVEAAGPPRARFAVSVEENIGKVVRNPKTGQTKIVTNALDRINARGDKSLTPKEELTVNLAIRELNKNGIAWTDHKLANFDIVPDPKSRTGHRMVFFDFDGFRPVKGKTRTERFKVARRSQRAYDAHLNQEDDLARRLGIDLSDPKFAKGTPQRDENLQRAISEKNGFDFRAFGDKPMDTLSSPGANQGQALGRRRFMEFNAMDDVKFARTAQIMTNSQNSSRIAATAAATVATVGGVGVIAGTVYVLSDGGRTKAAKDASLDAKDGLVDASTQVVEYLSPDDGVPIVNGISSNTNGFVRNPVNNGGGN